MTNENDNRQLNSEHFSKKLALFTVPLPIVIERPGTDRPKQWIVRLLFLIWITVSASGCTGLRYYGQAVHGEFQILAHRQSITKLVASPKTPDKLRHQLQLVQQLLAFAQDELKLPADHAYSKYVDLHRKNVVWDLQAAPQFSLEPKTWWYPILGRLAYRGYFSEKAARDSGDRLAKKGFDVYVDGVEAYSTLGWFQDPIMSTFVDESEADLAELLFHELAHRRVFINGDTDFNEAFATTVGQEGARRWLRSKGETAALDQYNAELVRDSQFVHLVLATRERLEKVFAAAGKNTNANTLLQEKQAIYDDLRRQYSDLKTQWGGFSGYDNWFREQLNNAKLNTVANYYDDVPGFEALVRANGGNLGAFYEAVQRLGKLAAGERRKELRKMS